jgi:hypothetical protein
MSTGSYGSTFKQEFNVIPVVEGFLNLIGGCAIPVPHVFHGGIGKHNAPSKGVIGQVPLYNGDEVLGPPFFHQ